MKNVSKKWAFLLLLAVNHIHARPRPKPRPKPKLTNTHMHSLVQTPPPIVTYDKTPIEIMKHNVLHTFVPIGNFVDDFVRGTFPTWENSTFEIFDTVKDPEGIAIDIGAWIGTTAIWLSKNFAHVVAAEPDVASLQCLRANLEASGCPNVTICERPVAQTSKEVVFGPRGDDLNGSMSYIKTESDKPVDYTVRAIPFKQLVHDYIYKNEQLASRKITFIKCDVEGGEEEILEDILHFAYYNNVKVYMSFHCDWWKSKKITDFADLFSYFKTECPYGDPCTYIQNDPFGSILFEPLNNGRLLLKENMPAIIIGYQQVTYIRNMVKQLEKYTKDIIVIDNASTFQPLLDYYKHEFTYTLLRQPINYGHMVYYSDFIQQLVGDVFILTDPDLEFNKRLPDDFIKTLMDISIYFNAGRVGFALAISANDLRRDVKVHGKIIKEWEQQFWQQRVYYSPDRSLRLFRAAIDTTFCLINKRCSSTKQIRIAGDFTCDHLPWHKSYKESLLPGEDEAYKENNKISTWWRTRLKK
ncbi:MAG: FkbM family methyltransferase [Candidatus Babeliales bacterium]